MIGRAQGCGETVVTSHGSFCQTRTQRLGISAWSLLFLTSIAWQTLHFKMRPRQRATVSVLNWISFFFKYELALNRSKTLLLFLWSQCLLSKEALLHTDQI